MNVIVSNKYQSMLETLDIEIIKSINGQFEVDELISTFKNFFFQRMILDITAIKNYKDIRNMQKLSISLDMDKVILLLDDSPESSSPEYLSKLISMGIYNFTKNLEGILYLYNNPNSYRDVAQYQQLDMVNPTTSTTSTVSKPVYNSNNKTMVPSYVSNQTRIIGVKNVTKNSGATTLIYMMKKQLEANYSVVAVEIDKRDFTFFKTPNMESVNATNFSSFVAKHSDKEVILVDTNYVSGVESQCTDMIYLIEPSIIKLNKLMATNRSSLSALKGKKVILNQSLLSSKDVLDFEYESKLKIFFNMPPLDEREKQIQILNLFLAKLGFERQATGEVEKKNGILGIFNI